MSNQMKYYPKDPYQHSASMLDTDDEDIREFHQLISKQIILANIGPDLMMRLYQNDVILLTNAFDMARREPDFRPHFFVRYYGWKGELQMTRTKDGKEREMQANVSQGYSGQMQSGFGKDLPQMQTDEEKNLFEKVFSKVKQNK